MSTRAEKLRHKLAELEAQYKHELAKDKARERKVDTRKKVLVGAMIFQWVKDGRLSYEDLLAGLDSFLLRDYDRAVFDLPPQQKPFPAASSSEKQPATVSQPPAVPATVQTAMKSVKALSSQNGGETTEAIAATDIPHSASNSPAKQSARPKPPPTEGGSSHRKRLPERAQESLESQFMM